MNDTPKLNQQTRPNWAVSPKSLGSMSLVCVCKSNHVRSRERNTFLYVGLAVASNNRLSAKNHPDQDDEHICCRADVYSMQGISLTSYLICQGLHKSVPRAHV